MKIKNLLLTLTLLPALCAMAGAQEFALVRLTAGSVRSASSPAVPLPAAAEPPRPDESETALYLADREPVSEIYSKSLPEAAGPAGLDGDGFVKLYHQWSRESLEIRYRDATGRYIPEAMARIKRLFRCRLTGKEMDVPAKLVEIIDSIQEKQGGRTVTVICGYRSPELNGALAGNSGGVAKNSLHMQGLAADIRIDGVKTAALRDTAKALKAGGVGYYPADGFVHVDTGRVRYW